MSSHPQPCPSTLAYTRPIRVSTPIFFYAINRTSDSLLFSFLFFRFLLSNKQTNIARTTWVNSPSPSSLAWFDFISFHCIMGLNLLKSFILLYYLLLIHTYIHIISCDCFYWSFPLHYSWFPWFGKRFGFDLGVSQHIIRSFIFFPNMSLSFSFSVLFCPLVYNDLEKANSFLQQPKFEVFRNTKFSRLGTQHASICCIFGHKKNIFFFEPYVSSWRQRGNWMCYFPGIYSVLLKVFVYWSGLFWELRLSQIIPYIIRMFYHLRTPNLQGPIPN